jgi:hypothetical protein
VQQLVGADADWADFLAAAENALDDDAAPF